MCDGIGGWRRQGQTIRRRRSSSSSPNATASIGISDTFHGPGVPFGSCIARTSSRLATLRTVGPAVETMVFATTSTALVLSATEPVTGWTALVACWTTPTANSTATAA